MLSAMIILYHAPLISYLLLQYVSVPFSKRSQQSSLSNADKTFSASIPSKETPMGSTTASFKLQQIIQAG